MARNLIGTGADQVSVNGMLGELAFQSKENINFTGGTGKLSKLDIEAISAQLGVTAVDVFVYDTRKDSDGGAWRKRCAHTSWYNEALNTSTRGSRRDFPAVAIIVATASSVIIYDGDSPDFPMWMVFLHDGVLSWSTSGAATPSSIFALNGAFALGIASGGVQIYNFVSDDIRLAYATNAYALTSGRFIVNRNSVTSYTTTGDGYIIASYNVYDVAMTVLPGTPIEPSTGIPNPTIVIATLKGVTVLRYDGSVDSSSTTSAVDKITVVGTTIFALCQSAGVATSWDLNVDLLPGAGTDHLNGLWNGKYWYAYSVPSTRPNIQAITYNYSTKICDNYPAVAGTSGVSLLSGLNDQGESSAFISSKYNTGWMTANTVGTYMSDIVSETVISAELVSNGTFDSNITGWTLSPDGTKTLTASGGRASLYVGTNSYWCWTPIQVIAGKSYVASMDVISTTATAYLRVSTGTEGGSDYGTINGVVVGKNQLMFTSGITGTLYVNVGVMSGGNTLVFDNVSVRIADPDRSVQAKHIQYVGTMIKTPVAPGADLVAYSNWGTGYMKQFYDSRWNFGTGDFTLSCWYNCSSLNQYNEMFDISDGTNTNRLEWLVYSNGAVNLTVSGTPVTGTTGVFATNVWNHLVTVRRNGYITHYVNGVAQGGGVNAASVVNANCVLYIGVNYNAANGNGQLALLRLSTTAATEDQIRRMYNDEKMLFQENAKAVLVSGSDSVNALAYDQDTQLLHVGTSTGRSVFQGLRRIDNTTTAVSTALSASNSLVAEQ